MSLSAVDDFGPDSEPEQLGWVEGFPAERVAFKLASTSDLHTDVKLAYNEEVHGSFAGRVKGLQTVEGKNGSLRYVYVVEVLDATLEGS